MVKIKDLKVMVAGTVPSAIRFIAAEFEKAGMKTEKVMESVDILPKIDELKPDMVVIDVQMEEVSTYEVIEKVKAMRKPRVFMALYSYFIDKDMAKESILHRLFASQTSHGHENQGRPIKYLGIFNENTFAHKIEAYLEALKEL
jgi:CheY-like chemotaxis protein